MPVYEYQCESCDHRYTLLVRAKDKDSEELPICPQCGGERVRKLISSVTVVRSASDKGKDRGQSLAAVDPQNPQEVARHFKEHGSRLGDDGFRGTDTWHDAIDRVAEGGPTLDE